MRTFNVIRKTHDLIVTLYKNVQSGGLACESFDDRNRIFGSIPWAFYCSSVRGLTLALLKVLLVRAGSCVQPVGYILTRL
jgi:hypothetical protein